MDTIIAAVWCDGKVIRPGVHMDCLPCFALHFIVEGVPYYADCPYMNLFSCSGKGFVINTSL